MTLEANPEDVNADAVAGVDRSRRQPGLAGRPVARGRGARGGRAAPRRRAGAGGPGDPGGSRSSRSRATSSWACREQTRESFRRSLAALSTRASRTSRSTCSRPRRRRRSRRTAGPTRSATSRTTSRPTPGSRWARRWPRAGFRHYEISNWARPGREARHNVKYWTRTPTLGLGVSAHELWAGRRRANVSKLEAYLEPVGVRAGAPSRSTRPSRPRRRPRRNGSSWACGSPTACRPRALEAQSSRAGEARLRDDYEGWLSAGILDPRGRPRALHRARVPRVERGAEPVRVGRAASPGGRKGRPLKRRAVAIEAGLAPGSTALAAA